MDNAWRKLRRLALRWRAHWLSPYRARQVAARVEHVSGPPAVSLEPDGLVVLCLVRDGSAHLEHFLEHHFRLGARAAVLLDNDSTDNTAAIARDTQRVTLLRCSLPYREYQYEYRRFLVNHFGSSSWSLLVDIDERFDFPCSSQIPMRSFLGYLNAHRYTAVAAHMLDLFPEGPLHAWPAAGRALVEASQWYDLSGLVAFRPGPADRRNEYADPDPRHWKGGFRQEVFGTEPMLTKHPLLFRPGGPEPVRHSSHFCSGGRVADVSCLLAHYKFDAAFRQRCLRAVREANYYDNSRAYRAYLRALQKSPDLTLKRATARRFRGVDELVREGFLTVSEEYRAWVRMHVARGDTA